MNEIKLCEECQRKLYPALFSMILRFEGRSKYLSDIIEKFNWKCEGCGNIVLEVTAKLKDNGTDETINYNITKK